MQQKPRKTSTRLPPIQDLARAWPGMSAMVDDAYSILGGLPRDPRLASILDQFWPECYVSDHSGKIIMAPNDVAKLEALYLMFGVPMLVSENSLEVLGHAYDVFCIGLSTFVSKKLIFPAKQGVCKTFAEAMSKFNWSQDWIDYIEAVAAEDHKAARKFAVRLNVLAPECEYPPYVYIRKPGEH